MITELHLSTNKDSFTVGYQLIESDQDTQTLIKDGAVNSDEDKTTAIDYIIEKLSCIYGACDVFLNGRTYKVV